MPCGDRNEGDQRRFVVIGGGPAGLTAAYELVKRGHRPLVLEKAHIVGGISRTEEYRGYRFDMGGHRFFTKVDQVQRIWEEILGDEFLERPRLSRIYYDNKFFDYPLKLLNALRGLGLLESARVLASYVRWQLFPHRQEHTFEQWVTNRFGERLFATFFKTYTEKVWGISCSELKAEWAAQRIKDLSLRTALLNMFKLGRPAQSLIERFHYPRLGPGMMWGAARTRIEERGGVVTTGAEAVAFERDGDRVARVVVAGNDGEWTVDGTDFISSMPITEFLARLQPPPPAEVLAAAAGLKYRAFLTVCLVIRRAELFPDNWIYVHDPSVRVGRIQNFKRWSPDMVPDPQTSSLGMEYFCAEGDEFWRRSDRDLIELAKVEIATIGLARAEEVSDGCVFRVPKSYPVYDGDYRERLQTVRAFVDSLANFQTVGRNGLHRYNNQDHAMLTGIYAVRNALLGEQNDLWAVNVDRQYHETIMERGPGRNLRRVEPALAEAVVELTRRIDGVALGTGVALTAGLALCGMTLILVVRGDPRAVPMLALLGQYLPGYEVSGIGSLLGLGYGALLGYCTGWLYAIARNAALFLRFSLLHRRIQRGFLRDLLSYL